MLLERTTRSPLAIPVVASPPPVLVFVQVADEALAKVRASPFAPVGAVVEHAEEVPAPDTGNASKNAYD